MKQRIISGLIGTVFVIAVLAFRNTIIFNIIFALAIIIALYEVFIATKYVKNLVLLALSFLFCVTVPFFQIIGFNPTGKIITYVFMFAVLVAMLFQHKTIKLHEVSFVLMMSIIIPFALSTLTYLNAVPQTYPGRFYKEIDGLFFILIALGGAWIGDTGAYFIGSKFGKHKLAPTISPKKTIEGAVGSVITTVLFFIILGVIWKNAVLKDKGSIQMGYMILAGVLCSITGMLGDLVFSFIKRSCKIKDYGNLIPGHGGILDRVDSVIFVAPFIYILLEYVPFIIRVNV